MKRGLFSIVGVGEEKTEEEAVHSPQFQWELTNLRKPRKTLL